MKLPAKCNPTCPETVYFAKHTILLIRLIKTLKNEQRMFVFTLMAPCQVSLEEDTLTASTIARSMALGNAINLANNDLKLRGEWPRIEGLSVGSY